VVFTVLILITGEIVLIDWLVETAYISNVETGFDILWWLVPAHLIYLTVKYGRFLMMATIYSMAMFGIVTFVYKLPIIGLIILLQIYIIGKLIIQKLIDKKTISWTMRIGDWLKIGEFEEGELVDITRKTTSIKTRDGCIINIPNHIVSESVIKNFCHPDNVYWLTTKIKVDAVHPPTKVKKILLDAALSADKILKEPSPVVIVTDMSNGTLEYTVAYCSWNYSDKIFVEENMLTRIFYHLKQADIPPAVESQSN
jgi:branched-chain amino acid transport system substrate-binding protein